jgi:ADP-heptose:LPS heptosyltransferase
LKKVLVIRFSSIGDIVLTTPLLRALKEQVPGVTIHYVTRAPFREILAHNPHVDKLFVFNKTIHEITPALKAENYDLVVDLHRNLRSLILKTRLRRKSVTFNKLNLQKFIAVNLKMKSVLPHKHIVGRYFETLRTLNVSDDTKGLEYYISEADKIDTSALFFKNKPEKFISLVIGGSYTTKKIPLEKLEQICASARMPVILLGGKEDKSVADQLRKKFPHLVNCSGLFTINQTASIIQQSEWVITSDTGMMHIASAYKKKIISVWGNTIPEFGMYPYLPHPESILMEIAGLRCRPCSKLGFAECPRKHFRCMMEHDFRFVSDLK